VRGEYGRRVESYGPLLEELLDGIREGDSLTYLGGVNLRAYSVR